MTIDDVPVFSKGRFRVVAVNAGDGDRERIVAYAILDSTGLCIRQELTLGDAKAWVERHAEEEFSAHAVVRTAVEPQRLRR